MEDKIRKSSSPAELKAQASDGTELICPNNKMKMPETDDELQAIIERAAEQAAEKAVAKYIKEKEDKTTEDQNTTAKDEFMTREEIAKHLGVSPWLISRYCQAKYMGGKCNEIPYRRIGKKYYFCPKEVDAWISKRRD